MRKQTWISVFFLVIFVLAFVRVQSLIVENRAGRRAEEKILMLSNRPEVTKILCLGHDSTVADLLWIRAIQYFGGNFSSLNKDEKKPGMMNLFRNMVALDPHFAAAYQFGGFVINESMKDSNAAVSFLLEGADKNPTIWRLRFDAGFIAFYQLQDYDIAKQLFVQTAYGDNYARQAKVETEGLVDGFAANGINDDDSQSEVKFQAATGSVTFDMGTSHTLALVNITKTTPAKQSFSFSTAGDAASAGEAVFQTIPAISQCGMSEIIPPISARFVRLASMSTDAQDGFFSATEVQLHGTRNPAVPSYVDRMAIEMDRAAGRFRVAWDQYLRYYDEAKQKGDEISATLAAQKLDDIYTNKVQEILNEAIRQYLEKEGDLPSPKMNELVEGGYLQTVLQEKMVEDSQFQTDILPVLLGANQNVYNILRTWDGSSPLLMLPVPGDGTKKEWTIVSRATLEDHQRIAMDALQKLTNQYKEEKGRLPQTFDDFKENKSLNAPADLFIDPLGGEFFINQQSGKVEARNPKY